MLHTNIAAVTIDLQAAHYQVGVTGLHALLSSLEGKVVHYRNAAGDDVTGHLRVSEIVRQEWTGVSNLDRTGFSFLVRLGSSSDFTACGVWADDEGNLDISSIGKGATISL